MSRATHRRRATAAPNGSSGRSRRTCCGVRNFDTVEQLRQALLKFREAYNVALAHRAARLSHAEPVPSEAASPRRGIGPCVPGTARVTHQSKHHNREVAQWTGALF